MTTWKRIARFAARPAVADWLIRRSMKTPFSHLPTNEDPSYMERFWLFNPYPISSSNRKRWQFPWSIRIHHIKREDHDRALHDHPWNARTIILKGDYVETRLDRAGNPTLTFWRIAGDTAKLDFEEYHTINEVSEGGVWTMFITGPWRGVWGFLVDGIKVPWKTYLTSPGFADGGYVGGFTGLPDGEIPAILQRGSERVLLPSQAPMWDGCGGEKPKLDVTVTCVVTNTAGNRPEDLAAQRLLARMIRRDQIRTSGLEPNLQLQTYVSGFPTNELSSDAIAFQPAFFGTPDTDEEIEDLRSPRTPLEWAMKYNLNKQFGKMGWGGKALDCEKLRIADQRSSDVPMATVRHPLDNIAEWRKGCSCAPNDPADCNECTTALIEAIEAWYLKDHEARR